MLEKIYSPSLVESKFYPLWEASGAFKPKGTGTPYTIIMPPANVTGNLHLGHALTFTLQDILIRFHRMLGEDVLWQPGTDHAGIATQMVVERQLESEGLTRAGLGREAFLKRVWKWKGESGGAIINQLKRLGASADWSRERFTMDDHSNFCVTKVFVELHKAGLIYKDKRLVNWDAKYQTAISDLEVDQVDCKGKFYYLKYPLEKGGHIVVATTRPETFFGDTAVVVNPEDARYKHLIGSHVILPLINRKIPILGDEHGDPEKGSGAVKVTPAHDFNDFEIGKRHGLESIVILDKKSLLNENVPAEYRGLTTAAAREKVIAYFEEQELLEKVEDMTHSVPHGDRSGERIEPRLTEQWYLNAEFLAKDALKAVETGNTQFVPDNWKATYFNWMRHIQPWCISRQLWWGHSIPAWYGPDGHVFVAETEEDARLQAQTHYGKEVSLQADPDVLDTWFSSALWPFVTLGWPEKNEIFEKHYPTNVLVTGFDIIFFWVARMMMMGLHFTKEVPFRQVYIHALVLDSKGQKMSKSKGNVIDPLQLIDSYGADAVRFTLSSAAAPGRDIKLSEDKVEANRNFATKFWNATRYAQMNGCALSSAFSPDSCQHPLNQWIVSEIKDVERIVHKSLMAYRFHEASNALYEFLWKTFCDWYLEFTKPLLSGQDEEMAEETRNTFAWGLGQVCHLLHPLMPFITEEIWQALGGKGLLISAEWPVYSHQEFLSSKGEINWIIQTISELRSLRSELNISPALFLQLHLEEGDEQVKTRLQTHSDLIQRLGRLMPLKFEKRDKKEKAIQIVVPHAIFSLSLEGLVDIAGEVQRLEKNLEKLEKEIKGLDQRLGNTEFKSKAPDHIIEELETRKTTFEEQQQKNRTALKRVQELL
jgi:valyl-tRNA synthetase